LKPVLEKLGLSRAFDRERADFSGINGRSANLFVNAATHATYLDVDEEGIEAAALTEFICSDAFGEDRPPVVVVDHPFLYLIRDTRSGCIIFLGRVIDPLME
jgi:serine protease inhibitor